MSFICNPVFFKHSITRNASISFSLNCLIPDVRFNSNAAGGTLHKGQQALFVIVAQGGDGQVEHFGYLTDCIHIFPSKKIKKTLDLKLGLGVIINIAEIKKIFNS